MVQEGLHQQVLNLPLGAKSALTSINAGYFTFSLCSHTQTHRQSHTESDLGESVQLSHIVSAH